MVDEAATDYDALARLCMEYRRATSLRTVFLLIRIQNSVPSYSFQFIPSLSCLLELIKAKCNIKTMSIEVVEVLSQ